MRQPPPKGARHRQELVVNEGHMCTASLFRERWVWADAGMSEKGVGRGIGGEGKGGGGARGGARGGWGRWVGDEV